MIRGKIENWEIYAGWGKRLARGLGMLSDGKLGNLAVGWHELGGDRICASVQEYAPKPPANGKWEAHEKHIDIQYMVRGEETMGCTPVAGMKSATQYDTENDIKFLAGELGKGLKIVVKEKDFVIFFPQDAHMPGLASSGNPAPVKKIVLKIAVE